MGIYEDFLGRLQAGGLTNPAGLAAVAATGQRESGYSPANVYGSWSDPSERGAPGTAGGVLSWRGPRFDAMRRHAAAIGDDPSHPSPAAQADFFLNEDPDLVARLQSARSPDEAIGLMNERWRFAGFDRPGGEAAARVNAARSFYSGFSGGEMPDVVSGGTGDAVAYGNGGEDTLAAPYTPPSNPGGLGGLGGVLQSDGFGNFLQSAGMSIMTSPSNNMFAAMPEIYEGMQRQGLARQELRQKRTDDELTRQAYMGALQDAGLPAADAAKYAGSPGAAKMVMDLQTQRQAREANSAYAQRLLPTGPSPDYGDYFDASAEPEAILSADPTSGMAAATRSTLLQADPLTTTMPDRVTAAQAAPTAAPPINKTVARGEQLYARADQLRQAAMLAETDDQRAMAKLALDDVNAQISHYEKWAERQNKLPDLRTFYDDPTGREYVGYMDPATQQPVRVGGFKAAPAAGAFDMTLPDGTRVSLGGKMPAGFEADPDKPGGIRPMSGGPGEQLPAELAARIAIADSFLGQVPDIQREIEAGAVTGPWDRFKAGNSSQSDQASTYRKLQSGADALQRLLTGAGMTESEVELYARRYLPTYTDDAASAADKLSQLQREVANARALALRGRGGADASLTPNGPKRGAAPDPLGIR